MLRHESDINGYAIHASDGPIGIVCDFLFDDATWMVRWLVVDTGNWLPGREILLPPSAVGQVNHMGHQFNVKLTRQQVKDCPDIDTHLLFQCRANTKQASTTTMAGPPIGATAPTWASWVTAVAARSNLLPRN